MNNPSAVVTLRRSKPTGPLPEALRDWCLWIHRCAMLDYAANPKRLTPEGKPSTWLDFMGQASERPLMEAAMAAGIFEVAE